MSTSGGRRGLRGAGTGGGEGAGTTGGVQIPASARKVVQSLKEIVGNSDDEIYSMLKECNMDLNETVQRLLNDGNSPSLDDVMTSLRFPPPPLLLLVQFSRLLLLLDRHWFTSAFQCLTFSVVGHGALPVYC
jgi:hypothetical protein